MLVLLKDIGALLQEQDDRKRKLDGLWLKFGDLVRDTRETKRITMRELARSTGISKSALSYMETGNRSWDIEVATRVVEALNKAQPPARRSRTRETPAPDKA